MLSSVLMLPHGAEIIPTPGQPYNEAFRPLHSAMEQAGQALAARKSDLVIMFTPHGYNLDAAYTIYLHERFQGLFYNLTESNIFGDIAGRMLWAGNREQADAVLSGLQRCGVAAEGLVHGSPTYPLALAWGESVPLRYLLNGDKPQVVLIGLPRSRHDRLIQMQDDLATLGRVLLSVAAAYPGAVSIVSSADLSHTHAVQSPYGYHESASVFDATVQAWATTPTRDKLERMLALQPTALACGMAGMCVLQTVLEAAPLPCQQLVYAAPTYFGMAVSQWA
jgi:aromatic ring-opening dioxygenase LigB subunit